MKLLFIVPTPLHHLFVSHAQKKNIFLCLAMCFSAYKSRFSCTKKLQKTFFRKTFFENIFIPKRCGSLTAAVQGGTFSFALSLSLHCQCTVVAPFVRPILVHFAALCFSGQGRLNKTGLWTPLHLTRLVATAARSEKEGARSAPARLLLRVASCLMHGCLQHCVTGNAAHLIHPIASFRVLGWTPNSVAPLRTVVALIRQLAATRSMSDSLSILEGCIGP